MCFDLKCSHLFLFSSITQTEDQLRKFILPVMWRRMHPINTDYREILDPFFYREKD